MASVERRGRSQCASPAQDQRHHQDWQHCFCCSEQRHKQHQKPSHAEQVQNSKSKSRRKPGTPKWERAHRSVLLSRGREEQFDWWTQRLSSCERQHRRRQCGQQQFSNGQWRHATSSGSRNDGPTSTASSVAPSPRPESWRRLQHRSPSYRAELSWSWFHQSNHHLVISRQRQRQQSSSPERRIRQQHQPLPSQQLQRSRKQPNQFPAAEPASAHR